MPKWQPLRLHRLSVHALQVNPTGHGLASFGIMNGESELSTFADAESGNENREDTAVNKESHSRRKHTLKGCRMLPCLEHEEILIGQERVLGFQVEAIPLHFFH
jgi:hypothetical protein